MKRPSIVVRNGDTNDVIAQRAVEMLQRTGRVRQAERLNEVLKVSCRDLLDILLDYMDVKYMRRPCA